MSIFMLVGDISLNSGPITTIDNNNMWDEIPFCNYNLSIDWTENQISSDSDDSHSDDNWGLFKNSGMHFTHLNVNKL